MIPDIETILEILDEKCSSIQNKIDDISQTENFEFRNPREEEFYIKTKTLSLEKQLMELLNAKQIATEILWGSIAMYYKEK